MDSFVLLRLLRGPVSLHRWGPRNDRFPLTGYIRMG
jgi:hypothetical protein